MPLSVWVCKQPGLENSVITRFDSGYIISRGESQLFDFREEVVWVFIKYESPDWNQRIISMRPDLCGVCYVISVVRGIPFWHHLNLNCPGCLLTWLDPIKKIFCMVVSGSCFDFFNLSRCQIFNPNICFKVVLNKKNFPSLVNPFECMCSKTIHMSISIWYSSFTHCEHEILHWFGGSTNPVPRHVWISQVGLRVPFSTMDYVYEFHRVPEKEEWGIIHHPILNALFSVKFQGESSEVPIKVRYTYFKKGCREAYSCLCFRTYTL